MHLENMRRSTVKILTSASKPDFVRPWSAPTADDYTGSGVVLKNKTILTNAHVIAYASHVEVKLAHSSKTYTAKIKTVGDDCDLALLTVEDEEFWKNVATSEIGEMPKLKEEVDICGFPKGGTGLSVTHGIVSRIESGVYCHSTVSMLDIQVDAPINPGNSGGPAFDNNGKIIGIVHQGMPKGQNIGYIIPPPVINHFLKDAQNPKYQGFPGLFFDYQTLENDLLREWAGLKPGESGIRVSMVSSTSVSNNLKEGDIILQVDNFKINSDATVTCEDDHLIDFKHIINQHFVGDTVNFLILRNQKQFNVNIKLDHPIGEHFLVPPYDLKPLASYFIHSGLAFAPLTKNYIYQVSSEQGTESVKSSLLTLLNSVKTKNSDQAVILTHIFKTEDTKGYNQCDEQVLAANGHRINNMQELISAMENNPLDEHLIELQYGSKIVVPNYSKEKNQRLLTQFGIHSDRSNDLKPVPAPAHHRKHHVQPVVKAPGPLLFMAHRPGFYQQQKSQEWEIKPYGI